MNSRIITQGDEMNVLSLFDGMSCGLVALKKAGIKVDNYFASEIDKYAIQIAMKNHPEIIRLGDINNYESWDLPKIDLIIGGSPCHGFSFAGKGLNFNDQRSALFFKFVEILWEQKERNPDIKFLLENVKMKKEHQNAISELLELEPVLINSALVSAQNRNRLYWCNWDVEQPEDKGIVLRDILESSGTGVLKNREEWREKNDKSNCIDSNYHKGVDNHAQRAQILSALKKQNDRVVDISIDNDGVRPHRGDSRKSGISEMGRLMFIDAKKTYTVISSHVPKMLNPDYTFRKLTPIECERLQTLPDNYTEGVSNTQRYKMIGNGWTIDAIKHILEAIPKP